MDIEKIQKQLAPLAFAAARIRLGVGHYRRHPQARAELYENRIKEIVKIIKKNKNVIN